MTHGEVVRPPAAPRADRSAGAATSGTGGYAALVAAGIFLSRIFGLVRGRVLAHYLGTSGAADAFGIALRGPNVLQNLFGEGVLSASFIPEYVGLLAGGQREAASRLASAVAALLFAGISVLVLLGIVFAAPLVSLIAPGFAGEKRELTILLVRVFFPGVGVLVLSAWCLGVLNSHRRFFLSYTAPVVWNLAIIGALWWGASKSQSDAALAITAAWGAVIGSVLQFGIQLPTVLKLLGGFDPAIRAVGTHIRRVFAGFAPVLVGRGAVQLSSWVDSIIASLLPTGAAAVLINYAQPLYLLPISLFGMSVSAAELPAMSSVAGTPEEISTELGRRLRAGLRQIAFFVVPSTVAFIALGGHIAGAIYQSGDFDRGDTLLVWGALAGYAIGLLASTRGRLYSSAFYALRDTRTPVKFSFVRIFLSLALGYAAAIYGPGLLGLDAVWGVVGLALASGISGWVEYLLLRRALTRKIGPGARPPGGVATLFVLSAIAAALAWLVGWLIGVTHPLVSGAAAIAVFGAVYLAGAAIAGVPETQIILRRVRSLLRLRQR
jgi:putative peptidoglycan lipid II flippase